MSTDSFEAIVEDFHDGGAWYAAWMAARQAVLHAAAGEGFSPAGIGWVAWRDLNEAQRGHALNQFFTAYFLEIAEEEREEQLQKAAKDGRSYLDGWEPSSLTTSLADAQAAGQVLDERAEVTVSALALSSVLAELELAQHRLAMLTAEPTGQRGLERIPDTVVIGGPLAPCGMQHFLEHRPGIGLVEACINPDCDKHK